jgi:polar amino acid transport system substrate-binding protein
MKRVSFVLALVTVMLALPAPAFAGAPAASIPGLRTPGTITYGTNFGYPPMEMLIGPNANIPAGADVDLGVQIARRLHLRYAFVNVTDFSAIIPGLQARRWDVILSSMNVTPERSRVVNFVPYMLVGQSILVRKGNPSHITTLADLSGKSVAVQSGTTEYASVLAENKRLAAAHKPLIKLRTFPEDTTAIQQLALGRFVAVLDDYPVAVYNVKHAPTVFQLVGHQFATLPYGMALRKSDRVLMEDVKRVFQQIGKDGTYMQILKKWGLTQAALK